MIILIKYYLIQNIRILLKYFKFIKLYIIIRILILYSNIKIIKYLIIKLYHLHYNLFILNK